MELLGTLGIILGIIFIIYLSAKGIHLTIAAPLATILVLLFNGTDIIAGLLGTTPNTFMGAMGNYIMSFFAVFLLGSILAKLMETSGATISIADFILSKIGTDNPYFVLLAIFVISAILTYGGISLFVCMFAVIPLAKPLFKKLDISWHLIQIPIFLGIGTITMTMLPGTPAIQNVIPMKYLGTTLTAAAVPSVLASIATVIFGLVYMQYCLKRSLAKGETYALHVPSNDTDVVIENLPNFTASILPLIVVVVLAISGSYLGDDYIKQNIIYIALVAGILLAILLFKRYIPNLGATLSQGGMGAIPPIFATALAVAFGAVVMNVPGFNIISESVMKISDNPLISLTLLTALMALITGSSSGALGIVMPKYAEYYLSLGLNPEIIHRVASIGSNIFTLPPHGGALITFLTISGLNHKNGFKEGFITIFGGALIAEIVVIVYSAFM